MQNARFQLMRAIDAKLCFHLMFQNSFQDIERHKHYCNFWGDRSELWPSKVTKSELFYTNRAGQKVIKAVLGQIFFGDVIFGNDYLKGICFSFWFCVAVSAWIFESLLRIKMHFVLFFTLFYQFQSFRANTYSFINPFYLNIAYAIRLALVKLDPKTHIPCLNLITQTARHSTLSRSRQMVWARSRHHPDNAKAPV